MNHAPSRLNYVVFICSRYRGLNNDSSGHTTKLTVNHLFKCRTSLIMNYLRRVEGKTKRTGCNLEREFDLWCLKTLNTFIIDLKL